ncbi:MAG: tRNA 2-selenouridine(34) synthase MnmH [Pseudomonadales bacterium]|nr:tRNA 2-selenouridine(34) synthase MnmH [Pseudomonadales bacterium]MCP5331633.1 tRNA 2-selenouridine(34) synthase MnmH [Pseudomonadales bacterium]MCP5344736.1 tRNA 2-selenouridine(34) synthase MnmH [Pseudomonadales bacterium]
MPDSTLYERLLSDNVALLDVRAPIEFHKGAFPGAHNIPLLNDTERAAVGTRYKQAGQDAAIALGNQLVCGSIRDARVQAWTQWLQTRPGAWLYCFRGGLRSQTVQRWLQEAGVECPRVPGGYKAMRQFMIDTLEDAASRYDMIVVAGPTGSGKTHLINALPLSVDLEGAARHRGSAFGTLLTAQPTQIDFEHAMATALLQRRRHAGRLLFVEDESRAIGSISIPQSFHARMKQSPIALIEESLEARSTTILKDYIEDNLQQFQRSEPDAAFERFSAYLLNALAKIQRRLGGERYCEVLAEMQEALRIQAQCGETQAHRQWINQLLRDYYDPMYTYQLSRRLERVVFRGDSREFLAWAQKQPQEPASA